MKVRDVMKPNMVALSPHTAFEDAARILYGNNVSGAPVVDGQGTIVGIISEKDLFRAMFPRYGEFIAEPHTYLDQERQEEGVETLRRIPIEAYMTSPAIVVHADAPLLRAGGLLLAYGLHRLPVIDCGRLVGMVTREDIFRTILQRRLFRVLMKADGSPHKTIITHR